MTDTSTVRKSDLHPSAPTGFDTLLVRERYLRSQRHSRRPAPRGWIAAWVAMGALVSWLFVVGVAALH